MTRMFIALLLAGLWAVMGAGLAFANEESEGVRVSFRGVETDLPIIALTVMPGERVNIVADANGAASAGTLEVSGDSWAWRAPQTPGLAVLSFERGGKRTEIKAFVMEAWQNGKSENFNGFRMGAYSPVPFRGLSTYAPPRGFIRATPAMLEEKISPHFTLGQFLCKQQPGHDPTYLLIRTETLVKLEALLRAVNEAGIAADTLTVMSGFRTPWYNRSIGNVTTSSRHLFGGAADVFVDVDGDGWMDDLNGDGTVDKADARWLARLGEGVAADSDHKHEWHPGGMGIYSANAVHGPFVHVDTRGYPARW